MHQIRHVHIFVAIYLCIVCIYHTYVLQDDGNNSSMVSELLNNSVVSKPNDEDTQIGMIIRHCVCLCVCTDGVGL